VVRVNSSYAAETSSSPSTRDSPFCSHHHPHIQPTRKEISACAPPLFSNLEFPGNLCGEGKFLLCGRDQQLHSYYRQPLMLPSPPSYPANMDKNIYLRPSSFTISFSLSDLTWNWPWNVAETSSSTPTRDSPYCFHHHPLISSKHGQKYLPAPLLGSHLPFSLV
jgi:hypothetical protein